MIDCPSKFSDARSRQRQIQSSDAWTDASEEAGSPDNLKWLMWLAEKEKKSDGRRFWRLPDPMTGSVVSGFLALQTRTLEVKSLAEIFGQVDKVQAHKNPTKKGTWPSWPSFFELR
jgi:hypothetical protein